MRAEGGGPKATRGLMSNIYRKHAAGELQQHLGFARTQESKDAFNARMGLANKKFKHSRKLHKQSMRDIEIERRYAIGGGLLGAGVAGYMGKVQGDAQRALDKQKTDMMEEQLKIWRSIQGTAFPQTTILRNPTAFRMREKEIF
jgi:hypothetical protein